MSTRRKELREQRVFWLIALLIVLSLVLGWLLLNAVNRYFSSSFYSTAESSVILEHEFDEVGFSYPASWILFETPNGNQGDMDVIAVLNPAFQSTPVIEIKSRELESSDLDSVALWGESRLILEEDYSNSPPEQFISNGLSGLTRMYTYKLETALQYYMYKCTDLYLNQKRIGYIFSFCSREAEWDKYNPVFKEILYSIKPLD